MESVRPATNRVIRKRPEQEMQKAFFEYMRLKHKDILCWSHQEGGRRGPVEGYQLKKAGMRRGIPDVFIARSKIERIVSEEGIPERQEVNVYLGLFLELKVKPNKPTPEQIEIVGWLIREGYAAYFCYSINECIERVERYFDPSSILTLPF